MKTIVRLLKAEKELLSNPKRWVKSAYAVDKNHEAVTYNSPNAVCWCQAGAQNLIKQINFNSSKAVDNSIKTIKRKIANEYNFVSAIEFNDSDFTDHKRLMEFYDKCIIDAENSHISKE